MKIKVIVEEIVSQEFEVEINDRDNAYEEIKDMYKDAEIVVDDPKLTMVNINILEDDGEETEWLDLCVV